MYISNIHNINEHKTAAAHAAGHRPPRGLGLSVKKQDETNRTTIPCTFGSSTRGPNARSHVRNSNREARVGGSQLRRLLALEALAGRGFWRQRLRRWPKPLRRLACCWVDHPVDEFPAVGGFGQFGRAGGAIQGCGKGAGERRTVARVFVPRLDRAGETKLLQVDTTTDAGPLRGEPENRSLRVFPGGRNHVDVQRCRWVVERVVKAVEFSGGRGRRRDLLRLLLEPARPVWRAERVKGRS